MKILRTLADYSSSASHSLYFPILIPINQPASLGTSGASGEPPAVRDGVRGYFPFGSVTRMMDKLVEMIDPRLGYLPAAEGTAIRKEIDICRMQIGAAARQYEKATTLEMLPVALEQCLLAIEGMTTLQTLVREQEHHFPQHRVRAWLKI